MQTDQPAEGRERLLDHQLALHLDPLVGRVLHHRELPGRDQGRPALREHIHQADLQHTQRHQHALLSLLPALHGPRALPPLQHVALVRNQHNPEVVLVEVL